MIIHAGYKYYVNKPIKYDNDTVQKIYYYCSERERCKAAIHQIDDDIKIIGNHTCGDPDPALIEVYYFKDYIRSHASRRISTQNLYDDAEKSHPLGAERYQKQNAQRFIQRQKSSGPKPPKITIGIHEMDTIFLDSKWLDRLIYNGQLLHLELVHYKEGDYSMIAWNPEFMNLPYRLGVYEKKD
ncbi:hypothetical protein KQX54_000899 [Cotesia glomerata]|uniref:FLYWCH-type domain-containing protein n=1 Tax=Cotesia glomerata TaxID=32391 RepID=A0AAV7IBL4_COTGL|nr:hypothetical protein KQX54_000899 [Cotesia glomerata]